MGDVNWRFGHGLRCAALICSLYSLLVYITALTTQTWWILRTDARQPAAVFLLAAGFGILVVLSSVLVVGIAMMRLKLYVIWLCFMLLWYAPELGLSLFVAIAVRNPSTVHGAGELAFTCVRSSLNVIAILIVHRLVMRERRRARLKRLLLATGNSYTSPCLSAAIADGDGNNAAAAGKSIDEVVSEECNNSSVLKSSILSLATFKDPGPLHGNKKLPLHQTLSESGANALSRKLSPVHTLPPRPASSAGNLSPPAMTGAVNNDYDELHHISEGEEEDEDNKTNYQDRIDLHGKHKSSTVPISRDSISNSTKNTTTKLSLTSTSSSQSGSSCPNSSKSEDERSSVRQKQKRNAPSPEEYDKRSLVSPPKAVGFSTDGHVVTGQQPHVVEAANVGQLFLRREIPTTNLDDTTDDDSKHSNHRRTSPQTAMYGHDRRSPPVPPPLPSAASAQTKSKFVITTLAHDGSKPLSTTNGHNNSRVAPIFEKRKRTKDDGDYYDQEFMRQWNCNFFALTPQAAAVDISPGRAPTASKSGHSSQASSSRNSSTAATTTKPLRPKEHHRPKSTAETDEIKQNDVRLYNELFAYRPKSIRHTPQMQDIAQMKRRPSMHERQLSTKEYPEQQRQQHPAADYDDHYPRADVEEERAGRRNYCQFAEPDKSAATSRQKTPPGDKLRRDLFLDAKSNLHKSNWDSPYKEAKQHPMEFLL